MDGKIYTRINEEVEVKEGNKKHRGGTDNKKWWRRENNKIVEKEKRKKLRREIKLKRERGR